MFTPLASAVLTGMPPFYPPIAFIMVAELGVFCLVISVLSHRTRLRNVLVLAVAILAERTVLLFMLSLVMPMFQVSYKAFGIYEIVKGLPGVILILVIVPIMVGRVKNILKRRSLRPFEHSHEGDDLHEKSAWQ